MPPAGDTHTSGAALTVRVKVPEFTVTGVVAESVTLNVKVETPAGPVGVPVIVPVDGLSESPAGSAPVAIAKVLVPVPPPDETMLVVGYTVPMVPAGSPPAIVVSVSDGFTVMDAVVADLAGSLMLVAVTVTVEATVPVAVSVVPGELPAALNGLTVPAPVAANVTPEALESFATAAVSGSVWPESIMMPVVGVENVTPIAVSAIVADADLLGSLRLVAVTTAVVVVTGLAEV